MNTLLHPSETTLNRVYANILSAVDPHAPITHVHAFPSVTWTTLTGKTTDTERTAEEITKVMFDCSKDMSLDSNVNAFSSKGRWYIVMSLKDGSFLNMILDRRLDEDGCLTFGLTTNIVLGEK